MAIGLGPLIGGFATTYFSWRWVFAGEVVVVFGILALARRVADRPAADHVHFDLVGAFLSAAGLGVFVYGILRTSEWGWFVPKHGGPSWLGISASIWLMLAGVLVVWLFLLWESHLMRRGRDPLVDPGLFANRQLSGGLIEFFLQYLVQMGVLFVVPLYLSVALGLSAIKTGVHILTTRYKRWIGIAILLIASVIFVFWSYPTGMVVFWFAFVIVIAFGIREFFAPGPGLVHRDETAVDARGPAPH